MERIKELLEQAQSETSFDVGRFEGRRDGYSISYASRPSELVTPGELGEMIKERGWESENFIRASGAMPLVPAELLARLESSVRSIFKDYIDPDTDRIGHAFPTGGREESHYGFTGFTDAGVKQIETWSSPVSSFTMSLIKGASVVGPHTISLQLQRWLGQADPVKYRIATILNDATFTKSIEPAEGIHLESLPQTSEALPVHLPSQFSTRADDFLGRTVIYLDHEATPAFFRPARRFSPEEKITVVNLSGTDFHTICQAISLEIDAYVETGFNWLQYQGPPGFIKGNVGTSWSRGEQKFRSWPLSPKGELKDWDITSAGMFFPDGRAGPSPPEEQISETLIALKSPNTSESIRTSLSRWMRAKDSRQSLTDRFIDLRIVLEALFLHDFVGEHNSQEMNFRLSLFGAWYLGEDFEERKLIRKKLREIYGKASGAVHGGVISSDHDTLKLLSDGLECCRRGIRKMLREGTPTAEYWGNLILGADASY